MPQPAEMSWDRIIMHADMDAFFAAVEQLDDPSLRGKPLLIGGTGRRSVVATASYEARKYGVGSATPMAIARHKVPNAIIRPPRFERYKAISQVVMGVFATFTEHIEPLSIDEAFLDMSHARDTYAGPWALGRAVKQAVFEATGLHVSVGVGNTKFIAKIASDFDKPDGLTVVEPHQVQAFLTPLPVSRLWGAGPKTVERLHALNLRTIGDVAAADPTALAASLGSAGRHFWQLAHNEDQRPVAARTGRKSLGAERTLVDDIVGAEAIKPHLRSVADEVGRRLKKAGVRVYGVRVKLKTRRFVIQTRQVRLAHPVDEPDALYGAGLRLLEEFELAEPLRLVGITGYDLADPNEPVQLELDLKD
jgi:DNA polymerase-4